MPKAYPPDIIITADEKLEPEEFVRVQAFKRRFHEIWANFEDLRESGFTTTGGLDATEFGQVTNQHSIGVSRFWIKDISLITAISPVKTSQAISSQS